MLFTFLNLIEKVIVVFMHIYVCKKWEEYTDALVDGGIKNLVIIEGKILKLNKSMNRGKCKVLQCVGGIKKVLNENILTQFNYNNLFRLVDRIVYIYNFFWKNIKKCVLGFIKKAEIIYDKYCKNDQIFI